MIQQIFGDGSEYAYAMDINVYWFFFNIVHYSYHYIIIRHLL